MKLQGKTGLAVESRDRSAEIKSVVVQRDVVAPGMRFWRRWAGAVSAYQTVQMRIKVPEDAPEGTYELGVGSSSMAINQEEEHFLQRRSPPDAKSLVAAVQRVLSYRSDHLYASLVGCGRDIGGWKKCRISRRRARLCIPAANADAVPLHQIVTAEVDAGSPPWVVSSGGEAVRIIIDKDAGKRFSRRDQCGSKKQHRRRATDDEIMLRGHPLLVTSGSWHAGGLMVARYFKVNAATK